MLIENQKNLNKVDLESNLTQKIETVTQKSNRKLSIHKTDEIKCSNIHMKVMTNLAIHTIAVLLQTPVPCPTKFLTKSHRVIYQRKKNRKNSAKRKEMKGKNKITVIKEKKEISKRKIQTIKERIGNLDTHEISFIINLKNLPEEYNQLSVVPLQENSRNLFHNNILKNLRMGEFNSFIESVCKGKIKTIKSSHHLSP